MKYDIKFRFVKAIHNYQVRVEAPSKREAITVALTRGLCKYHSEELRAIDIFPEGTLTFPGDEEETE